MSLLTLALDKDALDLQVIDLLLMLVWLVKVDNGQILFVQRGVRAPIEVTNSALERIQIIVILVGQFERLVQLFPKTARCLLQVGEFGVSVDSKRRCEGLHVGKVGLVTWVKIKKLDLHGLYDLLRFLDRQQKLSVVINIVQDLAT